MQWLYDPDAQRWFLQTKDGQVIDPAQSGDSFLVAVGVLLNSYQGVVTAENATELVWTAEALAVPPLGWPKDAPWPPITQEYGKISDEPIPGSQKADLATLSRLDDLGIISLGPLKQKKGKLITFEGQQFIEQPNGNWVPYNPKTAEAAPPLQFDTYQEAQAALQPGFHVATRGGFWTVEQDEVVSPGPAPEPPTLDEEITRLILGGRLDTAVGLADAQYQVDLALRGGRFLTYDQALPYIMALDDVTPEEGQQWLTLLTGGQPPPGAAQRPAQQPVTAEQAIEAGRGRQWYDATGNPIATPPFAAAMDAQAAARPFPTMPFGALPGAQAAIDRNRQQVVAGAFNTPAQEAQRRAAQGPFAMEPAEQAATGFQGLFQATPPPSAAPAQAFPTSIEEFDPLYADATPEMQELIRQEFERQRAAVMPSQPLDTTLRGLFAGGLPDVEAARQRLNAQQQQAATNAPTIADVLRMAQSGDTAGANSLMQQLVGAGGLPPLRGSTTQQEAAPQVFEPPFDISVLSPETQGAIRGGRASVFQSGPDVGGPGAGMQQSFRVQDVNGERQGVHQVFQSAPVVPQAPSNPFEEAIIRLQQRQQQQRRQRRFVQTPPRVSIFA